MNLDCIENSENRVQFSEVLGSRGVTKPPVQTCPPLGQLKILECQLMAGFCVISELILILYARSLVPIWRSCWSFSGKSYHQMRMWNSSMRNPSRSVMELPWISPITQRNGVWYICSWGVSREERKYCHRHALRFGNRLQCHTTQMFICQLHPKPRNLWWGHFLGCVPQLLCPCFCVTPHFKRRWSPSVWISRVKPCAWA